ncbi:Major histocompatibility complex class I-related gene protein [Merluccius polli]|uniref:Major histocompatibility complex class I-related gene protein n=1 Tax=Merluccius polli TaxID=89951 RepID=A0AA47MWL7_MERPO|nr:Major histocompatibility complex class I-related gene protein [Merluccius polli]
MYQVMYGCEWDDEDHTTDGYEQYGYDGEDYLAFDLKTLTWIAPTSKAFSTKQRWNQDRAYRERQKNYLTKVCVDWLKKHLAYGKSTLQRTERPEVSLLQRRPSSPVVCHATGFYPDRVVVFWRRDGEELYEHVDHGEVLPNPDGTFQVSVDLDLASVPQEDWRRYECVVQLKGIEDISTRLDPALVRTNWGKTGVKSDITTPIIIGCVVLLLAAVAAVGVFVYKKRNGSAKSRPAGSHSSSGTTEEQSPAPEAQPLTTYPPRARCPTCMSEYTWIKCIIWLTYVESSISSRSISYIRSLRRFLKTAQRRRDSERMKSATLRSTSRRLTLSDAVSSPLASAIIIILLFSTAAACCCCCCCCGLHVRLGGLHPSVPPSHSSASLGSMASEDRSSWWRWWRSSSFTSTMTLAGLWP